LTHKNVMLYCPTYLGIIYTIFRVINLLKYNRLQSNLSCIITLLHQVST
jgi:hypothetical protein